eukprot:TRINITY_DN9393_c0_g2_i2.p1 TRINITY_DN9393_c0_g2~~TRINITY_DN9393_c0_g2_i2.p1  ORF type:complete len:525 (+),score=100.84 TRINITY_DN9393_c0_g2_i2:100-1575(+)
MAASSWQPTGKGSRYGKVVDPDLSIFAHANLSGSLAILQVAHQFYTWSRPVTHFPGNNTLLYTQDLPSITWYANATTPWEKNKYYLQGNLAYLDQAYEWFHDAHNHTITVLIPCSDRVPTVELKTRDYVVNEPGYVQDFHLANLTIVGATVALNNCSGCSLTNINIRYPSHRRGIPEMDVPAGKSPKTHIQGTNIVLENITLGHSANSGLSLAGYKVVLRNAAVDDADWYGTLTYPPLYLGPYASAQHCTVYDFGNAGVTTAKYSEVAYTAIHHGGRVGKDTAALYSGGNATVGSVWHHNWVYNHTEKCLRGDDQSEKLTLHHNVAFNCGMPVGDPLDAGYGLVLKGNNHIAYANTFFNCNRSEVCLPSCPEPRKSWRHQGPLLPEQNNQSYFVNMAAYQDVGYPCSCRNSSYSNHPGGIQRGVVSLPLQQLQLRDPSRFDFRPMESSPLVGKAVAFPPYVNHTGDVGAYQHDDEEPWRAGCQGLDDQCIL